MCVSEVGVWLPGNNLQDPETTIESASALNRRSGLEETDRDELDLRRGGIKEHSQESIKLNAEPRVTIPTL